jgi:hypothetical protein
MPQLSDVLAGLLRDITNARATADVASAALVERYRKDPVLRHFPVPRTEIKEVKIDLRFGFATGETSTKGEVIVDAKALQELRDSVVSTVSITTAIANYDLLEGESDLGKSLVERER